MTVSGLRYIHMRYAAGMNVMGYRIGARNNSAVVMIPMACLRSRRNTPRDASIHMTPSTNGKNTRTTTGNRTTVHGMKPRTNMPITRSTKVETSKWNNADPKLLQHNVSRGKTTFLTNAVFSMIRLGARLAHSENSVFTFSPANRMMANSK